MKADTTLGPALRWLQRGEPERAIRELELLLERSPGAAELYNVLGSALGAAGRLEASAAAFAQAVLLRPDYVEAKTNQASVALELGNLSEALALFEGVVTSEQAPARAHVGLGRVCSLLSRHRDAAASFDRAVLRQGANATVHSQRCYASLLNPHLDAAAVIAIHRDYERAVVRPLLSQASALTNERKPARKLKLGYVSADFRQHSVASFLEPVLRAHDPDAVEVFAYSDVRREDGATERLRASVPRFHVIAGASHEQVATLVRQHGVDVLVDLSGHMQPNRLPLFGARPAPVLLTYLGYPGSTGLAVFNGRLSDDCADPSDDPELAGPEPLIRIEGGCFAYSPPDDAPEVVEAPEGAAITFGSMNDALKLNDEVLAVWGEILLCTPGSRLLLKSRGFSSADVRARVARTLASAGVAAHRFELLAPTTSRREHLETYHRVHVALDTFPYAGATTTCEALYMGVPVITLSGGRHAARMGESILAAVGLRSFVTRTRAEYVARAAQCALDAGARPGRLELRERLRASPLCDGRRVASAIEHAARALFSSWSAELGRASSP